MAKRRAVLETTLARTEATDRAAQGDSSALAEVSRELDNLPEVVAQLGDLGKAVLLTIVDDFAGQNLLIREAQKRFLAQLQRDVEGPSPTPLERLLAQEIVLCRLHLTNQQFQFAALDSYSFAEGEFRQKQIDRAQRRLLAAIKTLAQVRQLRLPAVQVNVATQGGQQMNVSGVRS